MAAIPISAGPCSLAQPLHSCPTESPLSSDSRRKVLPLLDLPVAVLRHIARHTSGQDSKSLRATCRALRAVTCPRKLDFNVSLWKDAASDPFGDEFVFSKGEWLRLSDSELSLLSNLRDAWQESAHSLHLVCEDLSFGSSTTLSNLLAVEGSREESKDRRRMPFADTNGSVSHSSEKCLVRKDSPSQVAARYQHKVLLTLRHWAPILRHVELPCLSPLVHILAQHCPHLTSITLSPPAFAAPPALPALWPQPVAAHQGLMQAQPWVAQQNGQDWPVNWMDNPVDEVYLDFAPISVAVQQGLTAAARGASHLSIALQALANCPKLRVLNVSGWKCSLEVACEHLAKLTQLHSLCIQCHKPKQYDTWGRSLAQLTNLTCLRMLPPFGYHPPVEMQYRGHNPSQGFASGTLQLGALTGLKILDAWGAGHVLDLSKCSQLTSLRMSWVQPGILMRMKHLRCWCGWTLDDGSAHALSHCPSLERVEVWFVMLTEKSQGVTLPSLRVLLVKTSYRNKFDLELSLHELAPNLQKLALPEHYCTLGCLQEHSNLSHLLLPLWTLFSPDHQAHVLAGLSSLTHLNVEGEVCREVAPALSAAASSQALTMSSSHLENAAELDDFPADMSMPASPSNPSPPDNDSLTRASTAAVWIPDSPTASTSAGGAPYSSPALSSSSLSSLPSFLSSPTSFPQMSSYLSTPDPSDADLPPGIMLPSLPAIKVLSIRVQDITANNPNNCIGHLLRACASLTCLTLEFRDQNVWTSSCPDKLLQNMFDQHFVWAAQRGALQHLSTVKIGLRVPNTVFDQLPPLLDPNLQSFAASESSLFLDQMRQTPPLTPAMLHQFFPMFDRSGPSSKSESNEVPRLVKVLTAVFCGLLRAATCLSTPASLARVELMLDFLGKVPQAKASTWQQMMTACERAGPLPFEVVLVDQLPSTTRWNEPQWDS